MVKTPIRICLSGVTGGVGRALLPAIIADPELELAGAVSRSAAGMDAGEAIGEPATNLAIVSDAEDAFKNGVDVLIDYTSYDFARENILKAFANGIPVVLGTTGFSEQDLKELGSKAREAGVGLVTGNFSLTAALLQHFALFAAQHLDHFEVIDTCKPTKPDAPSGTGRELAEKLGDVKKPKLEVPLDEVHGEVSARGAIVNGVQCHSLRLPGFASRVEAIFGTGTERLTLCHEAITHGEPFVKGSLLAARKLAMKEPNRITGAVRGLNTLLFAGDNSL